MRKAWILSAVRMKKGQIDLKKLMTYLGNEGH